MEMPVVFKKGIGIILAVPITQLIAIHDDAYMSAFNTCQTAAVILGSLRRLSATLDNLSNNNLSNQRNLLAQIKTIIDQLHESITNNRDNFSLSIIQNVSRKNEILTMNFVGYQDGDHWDVNTNTDQLLINKFLMNTGINFGHRSIGHDRNGDVSLDVLIDNGTRPPFSEIRDLTAHERNITNNLLNFFRQNNFPRTYNKNGDAEQVTLFNANDIDLDDPRYKFRIVHYIQSLITAIMFKCIDEPSENRTIIARNIINLLERELKDGAVWINTRQNGNENNDRAVDFLIRKILNGVHLQNQIDNTVSIKTFANAVYAQLDTAAHVTQIEFIKLNQRERRIADGFLTNDAFFCIPLSKYLREVRSGDISAILNFLKRIEKFALQFSLENSIELEKINLGDITDDDWKNALFDLENISYQEQQNFIQRFRSDTETVNILEAALGNYTNETFPAVSPETIRNFPDQRQNEIFMAHIDVITQLQLAEFRPTAIRYFVDRVCDFVNRVFDINSIDYQEQFINFIMRLGQHLTREQLVPVDFGLLNDDCRTHLLLYHELNDISLIQIQQISLSTLEPARQALILRDRINDLAAAQIQFFDMANLPSRENFSSLECLHLLLQKRFDDLSDQQFTQIDFQDLTEAERNLILANKMHLLKTPQIQNLNLQELKMSNPQLYRKFIKRNFALISPEQLPNLELNGQSIEESRAMYSFFRAQTRYYIFLQSPNENILTREILESMPNDEPGQFKFNFQLIYLFHYINLIPDDVKDIFAPAIRYVFENPKKCPSEIFATLLDERVWPGELIAAQVANTNLNEFPRNYLCDLFRGYEPNISVESKDAFDINLFLSRSEISWESRLFIFDVWLTNFRKTRDKIAQLDIKNLNQNEIQLLVTNAVDFLAAEQTKQIAISNLAEETLLLFLNTILPKGANYISDEQINTLDCNDPNVVRLILNANRASCFTLQQIRSIDLNQLGQAISKLIAMKIESMSHRENIINALAAEGIEDPVWCFEMLTANQIQQISFDWIDARIRTYFFSRVSNFLTQKQVASINFELDNSCKSINVRCRILNNLLAAHKLHFLQGEQLCQLNSNIFKFRDENLVRTLFSMYASFYTHNQDIAIDQIPNSFLNLNLGNVETGLLNYIVKNMCSDLTLAHIQQINLQNLSDEILNNLVAEQLSNLSPEQINNLNLQLLTVDNFCRVINERNIDIRNEQLNNFTREKLLQIPFDQLTTESQARLLAVYIRKVCEPSSQQINSINLQDLESINPQIYTNTLMSFCNLLSVEQFMTINWLKQNVEHFVAFNFLDKLDVDEENQINLSRLLCDDNQEFIPDLLENVPDENRNKFKVALLNSRFLNQQFDFIDDDQRENFFGAVQIMFGLSKTYLQSVEYVINHWNNILHAQIQHLKTIADFSPETVNTLLRDYLSDLSIEQLNSLNVSHLDREIVYNALLERAADFTIEQLNTILGIRVNLGDENISNLSMYNLPAILINFLINKKLSRLSENQIDKLLIARFQAIRLQQLGQCCRVLTGAQLNNLHVQAQENFLKLFDQCALMFTQEQLRDKDLTSDAIQSLIIDPDNQHVAGILLVYRINDLLPNQIQSMDFNDGSLLTTTTQEKVNRSGLEILRQANRYKDLSKDQFDTMLNYTDIPDVIQILNENQEARINAANAAQINLAQVYDALSDMPDRNERFTRLFNACALFFTPEQIENEDLSQEAIRNIIIGPDNQHVAGILLMYRIKDLSPNQIQNVNLYAPEGDDRINPDLYMRRYAQAITLRRVNHNALTLLCEANRFKDLSDAQLNSMIDFSFTPNIIQILSENIEGRINNEAKAQQINLAQVYDELQNAPNRNELFTRLFNACALFFTPEQIRNENLSQEAIQSIIIRQDNQYVAGILLCYRISDLSPNQIQNMNLYVPSNDEERNPELCLKKYARVITMRRVNDSALYLLRQANRYKDLSDNQLNTMLNYNNALDVIQIIIENQENRINEANARKINLHTIYNALNNMPDRNAIFTRLFNACAAKFTQEQIQNLTQDEIQAIDLNNRFVAAFLSLYCAKDLSQNQIQALDLRQNSTTIRQANRYKDLSDNQFNNQLNFAFEHNIIQILKEDIGQRVAHVLIEERIREINLPEVWIKVKENNELRPRFFEFIAAFDDLQLTILAKPENNLANSTALGLLLVKYLKNELQQNDMQQQVVKYINNLIMRHENDKRFDEVYFAKCILLATSNIPNTIISPDEEKVFWGKFFDMFKDPAERKLYLTRKIRNKHTNDLVFGNLEKEGFKITPGDLQYIVLQKFRTWNTPNKTDAEKKDRINEKVGRLSSFFRCSLSSEYRDKLERIKAIQVRRGTNESEFIINAEI